jgi:erythronate-4-phosphate dehydrogenase
MLETMRVIVDQNIPLGPQAFSDAGEVVQMPGRDLRREDLEGAHVLIVRSITKVGPALLEGTDVKFVGTCTIGTDHLDIPWLGSHGIRWTSAPGCNARSVAEWVVSALAAGHRKGRLDLSSIQRAGIVGAGRVGRQMESVFEALGWDVWKNDPPRAEAEGPDGFRLLEDLLENCPVVTAHLPLVRDGNWPTTHLLGRNLSNLSPGAAFLNAGRGATASTADLVAFGADRPDVFMALDVLDPEPAYPTDLVRHADLASPHIAGYSLEGKIEGTRMVREVLGEFLNLPAWTPPPSKTLPLNARHLSLPDGSPVSLETDPWDAFAALVVGAFDPTRDDAEMRKLLNLADTERGQGFDRLRKEYPQRLEWRNRPVAGVGGLPPGAWEIATRVGFRSA